MAQQKVSLEQLQKIHTFYGKVGVIFWISGVMMTLGGLLQIYSGYELYETEASIETVANFGYAVSGGAIAPSFQNHHGADSLGSGIAWAVAGLALLISVAWLMIQSRRFKSLPPNIRDSIPRQGSGAPKILAALTQLRPSTADELAKLHGLLNSGALTESEFIAAKKLLLEKAG